MKVFDPSVDVTELTEEWKALREKMSAIIDSRSDDIVAWERNATDAIRKRLTAEVMKALKVPFEKRNFDQKRIVFFAGVGQGEVFRALNERYDELDELLNKGTTTLVMEELKEPRATRILIKGDFTRPDEVVFPGTPSILHPLVCDTDQPNRLDLANWIISRDNPLTARVIVNRIWQHYFGRGLVETENDFGFLGSQPSHPELLDWLACEFVEQAWSIKAMHRRIVTSHTYRQTSIDRHELREKDPHNYLLGRQRRLRLDGEIVRDVALTASGLLSKKIGGPPVFPPIPDGVMNQGQVKRDWKVSKGPIAIVADLYVRLSSDTASVAERL